MSLDNNLIIKVPSVTPSRYEIWSDISTAQKLLTPALEGQSDIKFGVQALWNWSEINEGIAEVYPETQESYVPQMLNLQDLNAISFKKGCYTGQEIVARMKYLGKLKKEMFLLSATLTTPVTPGADLYATETGKKVGSIVRTVSHSNNHNSRLLAVLDIEAAKVCTPLSLSDDSSEVFTYLSLPYKSEVDHLE
nr:folate-binding protein YgfZ [Alkalimarinus sediminis]